MSTPQPPEPPSGDIPPRSRGSHRAEKPASTSLLLPLLGVLGVLAALGLAGYMLLTSGDDEDPGATPRPPVTTTAPSADGEPTDEPSDDPTDEPSDDPSDKPSDKGTKTPSEDPTKNNNGGGGNTGGNGGGNTGGNNEPTLGPVPQLPVYVFNQTSISGLAAQTASELSAGGWNVAGYDNWRGSVPEDTVYYYPGRRNAAVRLARQFPYIGRVWPATSPMPGGALTVILAETDRK